MPHDEDWLAPREFNGRIMAEEASLNSSVVSSSLAELFYYDIYSKGNAAFTGTMSALYFFVLSFNLRSLSRDGPMNLG